MSAICFLVFCTCTSSQQRDQQKQLLQYGNTLGAGAILSASFLHLLPEANIFLSSISEEDRGWQGGACILTGLLVGAFIHVIFGHSHDTVEEIVEERRQSLVGQGAGLEELGAISLQSPSKEEGGGPEPTPVVVQPGDSQSESPKPYAGSFPRMHLVMSASQRHLEAAGQTLARLHAHCWNVFFGDLVHNFLDGVLVAAAFSGCSTAKGWAITAAVAAHEIPQEIADVMVLLSAGMPVSGALAFNLVSSMAAILGAVVVLCMTDMQAEDLGFLLMFGVGIFIFLGATELLPHTLSERQPKQLVVHLAVFAFGAVIVSLALLNHGHCDAGVAAHDHGDHGGAEEIASSSSGGDSHEGHDH
uniref:Uncharacterized protein n=1 Tax=Fibrocapsa japonica TaxID=94617 RepID=A0A7S2XX20_9STRA